MTAQLQAGTPQLLLEDHLKALRLPTVLRDSSQAAGRLADTLDDWSRLGQEVKSSVSGSRRRTAFWAENETALRRAWTTSNQPPVPGRRSDERIRLGKRTDPAGGQGWALMTLDVESRLAQRRRSNAMCAGGSRKCLAVPDSVDSHP
jgi:hypothetical protein